MTQLLIALIGGFFGALFVTYLPRLLFAPRLHAVDMDYHSFQYRLIVVNTGRMAAVNAVGRITIRPINQGDVVGTYAEVFEARKHQLSEDWRQSVDAYLRTEDWQVGIEAEPVHWATAPNQMRLTINPSFPERLIIAHSDGPHVDIPSENRRKKRARLALDSAKAYYGEVVVSAENSAPSKPFRFRIELGPDGTAIIEQHKGTLPGRP